MTYRLTVTPARGGLRWGLGESGGGGDRGGGGGGAEVADDAGGGPDGGEFWAAGVAAEAGEQAVHFF